MSDRRKKCHLTRISFDYSSWRNRLFGKGFCRFWTQGYRQVAL